MTAKSSYELIHSFQDLNILIIGDAILDIYYNGLCRRMCQEGPVPIVEECERHDFAGGAANAAVNVSALHAQAALLATLGNDGEGSALRRVLQKNRVNIDNTLRSPERRTLTKQRVVGNRQLAVRFDQGTTSDISGALHREMLSRLERCHHLSDAIIISDYGYGTVTPALIEKLARLQARCRRFIALDSKTPARYRQLGINVVKPNFRQVLDLLNLSDRGIMSRVELVTSRAKDLHDITGAEMVAVTLDCEGTLLFDNMSVHRILARPAVEACTSGAGDTFLAALTLALAAGASPQQGLEVGGAAAAVVVRDPSVLRTCTPSSLLAELGCDGNADDRGDVIRSLRAAQASGHRIVLTNGCFDILHCGHVNYLKQAKRLGEILVVGVNTDESIRRLKGPDRPINSLSDRISVLSGLADVDHVIPFAEDAPHRLIAAIRPDIFVKGGDYTRETLPEADLVERCGGRVVLLPYMAQRSTSRIINQIRLASSTGAA